MNKSLKKVPRKLSNCGNESPGETGVTLIELLVVVIIVGILAVIAFPSYTQYVRKSHRTAAKTALLDMASREERLFSTTNAYTATLATLGYAAGASVPVPDANNHYYDLSVANVTNNPGAPSTYALQAIPFGSQAADSECNTFTLDNLGSQQISGGTGSASTCWK